ncbi:hypothetical protein O6H91_05G091100 [Diphasiastrum complanatum]|nr:hypothetical protein O6H91_05G091100 [Diphasiastrum complanatum]KAJ7556634.1 hypothetical protein O6H91_05G091100 [Diphasiastrum complanatum]KAJ7556635.1 hypothetical protein O6H91_05G091100 [Diphasiastrum complanatum]
MTEITGTGVMDCRSFESTKDGSGTLESAPKEDSIGKASSSCRTDASDLQPPSWSQYSHGRIEQEGESIIDDESQQKLNVDDLASVAISGRRKREYVVEYNIPNGWDDHTESELEELLMKSLDSIYKEAASKIMSIGYSAEKTLRSLLKNGRLYGSKDAISNVVENAIAVMSMIDQDSDGNSCGFSSLRDVQSFSLKEVLAVLKAARPSLTNGDAMWCLLVSDMNLAHACAIEQAPLLSLQRKEPQSSQYCAYPQQSTPTPSTPIHLQSGTSDSSCIEESNPAQLQLGLASSVSPLSSLASSQPMALIGAGSEVEQQVHPTSRNLSALKSASNIPYSNSSLHSDDLEDDCVLTMAQPYQKPSVASLMPETVKLAANYGADIDSWKESMVSVVEVEPVLRLSASLDVDPPHERPAMRISVCETVESNADRGKGLQSLSNGSKLACSISSSVLPELHTEVSSDIQASQLPGVCSLQKEYEDDATSVSAAATELSLSLSPIACDPVKLGEGPSANNEEARATECKVNESTSISSIFQKRASERQDRALRMLLQRIRDLETQLRERTEWAQEKVVQAARRLSKDLTELKTLRAEREEALRLNKEKQALEESTMKKLSEMENALRKARGEVDQANAAICRLKTENAEVRAEMEAAKLNAAESVATCEEVVKREKKSVKKAQAWEKQKAKLQEELSAERRKIVQLQQQFAQGKEHQQQAEVRWRQEEKAKEEAVLRAEFEKRSREQAEAAAKKREETIRRKAEANSQRHRDDIERLERELSQLRFASEPLPLTSEWHSSLTSTPPSMDSYSLHGLKEMNARLLQELADLQDLSRRDVRRDRECVMCMSEEMAVVFLPCAHQVVCVQCNDLHEKQGMTDCPSCRTPIQRRIRVFGVSSK